MEFMILWKLMSMNMIDDGAFLVLWDGSILCLFVFLFLARKGVAQNFNFDKGVLGNSLTSIFYKVPTVRDFIKMA